jgi:hypothetical protein
VRANPPLPCRRSQRSSRTVADPPDADPGRGRILTQSATLRPLRQANQEMVASSAAPDPGLDQRRPLIFTQTVAANQFSIRGSQVLREPVCCLRGDWPGVGHVWACASLIEATQHLSVVISEQELMTSKISKRRGRRRGFVSGSLSVTTARPDEERIVRAPEGAT